MSRRITTIVIGSLNTDIVASGIKKFPKSGEHVYGKELKIGPGGKSRNIADMIGYLSPKDSVAMVGRTSRDAYGLWKLPVETLQKTGVNTDYINVVESEKLPAIALIPVDVNGDNQIIVLPGVSDDFSPQDIDKAEPAFAAAGKNSGLLVFTLECPLNAVTHALNLAKKHGLKVLFDPGGVNQGVDLARILQENIYLIKPNEHEAKMLSGVEVVDFESAKSAARKIQGHGIENVLITVGAEGAYLFTPSKSVHIPVPEVKLVGEKDSTGCGDQTMAGLCAFLQEGKSLEEASILAVAAGTLQFHKAGIQPITKDELLSLKN